MSSLPISENPTMLLNSINNTDLRVSSTSSTHGVTFCMFILLFVSYIFFFVLTLISFTERRKSKTYTAETDKGTISIDYDLSNFFHEGLFLIKDDYEFRDNPKTRVKERYYRIWFIPQDSDEQIEKNLYIDRCKYDKLIQNNVIIEKDKVYKIFYNPDQYREIEERGGQTLDLPRDSVAIFQDYIIESGGTDPVTNNSKTWRALFVAFTIALFIGSICLTFFAYHNGAFDVVYKRVAEKLQDEGRRCCEAAQLRGTFTGNYP